MAVYKSDQLFQLDPVPSLGGLAGAPQQNRGSDTGGKMHVKHFTLTNSVVSPALGGSVLAINDVIWLAALKVTVKIYFGRIYYSAWGAGSLISVGKIDPNNAANTDAAHYLAASSVAAAGSVDINLNVGEQVGTDPAGDQTTGQKSPQFGSSDIILTITVTGAIPAGGATLNGFITFNVGD